jgi:hypothetical protein
MRASWVFVMLPLATAAAGCAGRGAGGSCADLVACGGDVTGNWVVDNFCQFAVPTPFEPTSTVAAGYVTPQSPTLQPKPPSKVTSGDWCSGLVYVPKAQSGAGSQVLAINFYSPPGQVEAGVIDFVKDGTYLFSITSGASYTTHFSRTCLNAYGAQPTCDELVAGLTSAPNPNYQMVSCVPTDDDGCNCSYRIAGTGADTGHWRQDPDTGRLHMFSDASGNPPATVDVCRQRGSTPDQDALELGGFDGSSLVGSAGLRYLQLKPAPAMTGMTGMTGTVDAM